MQTAEIENYITRYIQEVKNTLDILNVNKKTEIIEIIKILNQARLQKKQIFIFGNGGSGSTASHFACDLAKGTIASGKSRFKAIALTDNMPQILAWANDSSYDDIFKEQLENLMDAGDIAIGISGSGNSKNVLKALEYAKLHGIAIGFSGFEGGKMKTVTHINLVVDNNNMQQIEDIHLLIEHLITSIIRNLNIGEKSC